MSWFWRELFEKDNCVERYLMNRCLNAEEKLWKSQKACHVLISALIKEAGKHKNPGDSDANKAIEAALKIIKEGK